MSHVETVDGILAVHQRGRRRTPRVTRGAHVVLKKRTHPVQGIQSTQEALSAQREVSRSPGVAPTAHRSRQYGLHTSRQCGGRAGLLAATACCPASGRACATMGAPVTRKAGPPHELAVSGTGPLLQHQGRARKLPVRGQARPRELRASSARRQRGAWAEMAERG